MSLRFYLDHNVHYAVGRFLTLSGYACIAAEEDGHARAIDTVILDRAALLDCVLITYDFDFVTLNQQRLSSGGTHNGIIHVRIGSITFRTLFEELSMIAVVHDEVGLRGALYMLPL